MRKYSFPISLYWPHPKPHSNQTERTDYSGMQSLLNYQALTGKEQLSKAGSSLKAVSDWWAKELSQTFGWPWDVNTVQVSSLCFWECIFFLCFWEVFITWCLILHPMRYLVDTVLFFSKFYILEYMYIACRTWMGETEYLEWIIPSFSYFQNTE